MFQDSNVEASEVGALQYICAPILIIILNVFVL